MSLPIHLDPNSADVGFGGNIESQCKAGTYPECRAIRERGLARAVENGTLSKEEAASRLKAADAQWAKAQKDPEVKAKLKEREKLREEHEDAIKRAAAAQIAELRGDGEEVTLEEPKKK